MLKSLNSQILCAAVLGILFGWWISSLGVSPFAQHSLYLLSLLSSLFIGLLKMLLIPLIFSSIVVGVANLQAIGSFGRACKITVLCFVSTTCIALSLGLLCAHIFQPGVGLDINLFKEAMTAHSSPDTLSPSAFFSNFLQNTLINPVKAMAEGNVLCVVIFALMLGAVIVSGRGQFQAVEGFFQQFFAMMMRLVNAIMYLAPLGIFALLAKLLATEDFAILGSLAEFAAVVTGTTMFHGLVILPMLLWIFGKISPLRFLSVARPALITAFATSSSSATMPLSMRCAQQLGVRPQIVGFVVPLGAQLNMDGTALYEAAAALFVANLMGLDLSLSQQLIVCLTAMLASLGAPGIPSAGMVTMIMVLQSVGLPAEAIAILLPIDRLLDTVRTVVNVQGDMMISAVVERFTPEEASVQG
jgi:Na+/H+-dicarboxylate symporter